MQAHPDLPQICTNVKPAVERYGDDIWDIVCATVDPQAPFRMSDVVPAVAADLGLSHKTAEQYTRAVLRNVSLEPTAAVQRHGHLWHWNHRRETAESAPASGGMTAEQFKTARRSLGLSTGELGQILDTDPRTIRRWEDPENDRTPNPIACRVLRWMQAGFEPPEIF